MKYQITCISDTHANHEILTGIIGKGDILLHAGDIMRSGYSWDEIHSFLNWYDSIDSYKTKAFIAGNHDRIFQNEPEEINNTLKKYKNINYLFDNSLIVDDIKIWGTPWQPWFFNWAFNVHRGEAIKEKWDNIPEDTDILLVHGPPRGILDIVYSDMSHVGCEDLLNRIYEIKPKIVVFGHIHESHGHIFKNGIHFINASVLDQTYSYRNKPFSFEWDSITNDITLNYASKNI